MPRRCFSPQAPNGLPLPSNILTPYRPTRQTMNMKTLRLLPLSLLGLLALGACSHGSNEFTAEGTISDAAGKTLYLETTDTDIPQLVDSVTLDDKGHFSFHGEGHSYPAFYRLRIGETFIPFAADSLTHLTLSASAKDLFSTYKIESGDEANKQIREIGQLRATTDKAVEGVLSALSAGTLERSVALARIDSLSTQLKNTLTSKYIYSNPKGAAAYFALFQSYRGGTYFALDAPGDDRAFAAVATAYDAFHPTAPYTPLLKQAALRSIAMARARKRAATPDTTATASPVEVVSFPEIRLRDQQGKMRSLTAEVAKGAPILVCFTAYAGEWSPALVSELRALHAAHPDLVIFEVSEDQDAYLWKNAARNLPWISVHDLDHSHAQEYNVQGLPSFFSIRGSELKRLATPADIYR